MTIRWMDADQIIELDDEGGANLTEPEVELLARYVVYSNSQYFATQSNALKFAKRIKLLSEYVEHFQSHLENLLNAEDYVLYFHDVQGVPDLYDLTIQQGDPIEEIVAK